MLPKQYFLYRGLHLHILCVICFPLISAKVIAETKQGQPLPKFGKLGKLKLTGSNELTDHITNAEALFDLLHAMPFLNTLVMKVSD